MLRGGIGVDGRCPGQCAVSVGGEPEALQLTNTAVDNPNQRSAQRLATGKGVRVAFLADGLDVNIPPRWIDKKRIPRRNKANHPPLVFPVPADPGGE